MSSTQFCAARLVERDDPPDVLAAQRDGVFLEFRNTFCKLVHTKDAIFAASTTANLEEAIEQFGVTVVRLPESLLPLYLLTSDSPQNQLRRLSSRILQYPNDEWGFLDYDNILPWLVELQQLDSQPLKKMVVAITELWIGINAHDNIELDEEEEDNEGGIVPANPSPTIVTIAAASRSAAPAKPSPTQPASHLVMTNPSRVSFSDHSKTILTDPLRSECYVRNETRVASGLWTSPLPVAAFSAESSTKSAPILKARTPLFPVPLEGKLRLRKPPRPSRLRKAPFTFRSRSHRAS